MCVCIDWHVWGVPMEGSCMIGEEVALRLCTRLPSSFRAHTITCWLADTSAAPALFSPLESFTTASVCKTRERERGKERGRDRARETQRERDKILSVLLLFSLLLYWGCKVRRLDIWHKTKCHKMRLWVPQILCMYSMCLWLNNITNYNQY